MDGQRGDDGGREFRRVSAVLRDRISDGEYPPGAHLPPQRALAQELGVSRDTVQRVLKQLVEEGWISSRQGSGSRVLKAATASPPRSREARPGRMTLGPFIAETFAQPEISLDVFTLTSESLEGHVRLQAERIRRSEIAPQRIALRMLLPSVELPYPTALEDPDDTRPRDRLMAITLQYTSSLRRALETLKAEGLVPDVETEVRYTPLVPYSKIYLLNRSQALTGTYEVIRRPVVLEDGTQVRALDVLGIGASLTRHVKDDDPDSAGSIYVESMQAWFDSVWELLTG